MNKMFALLLATLMATFALTGCGNDKDNGTASRAMDNGVTDNGAIDDGVMDNGMTGTDLAPVTPDPSDSLMNEGALNADGTVNNRTVNNGTANTAVRGATYEQMLRNGTVHDTDGILTDHENAMTPGTAY